MAAPQTGSRYSRYRSAHPIRAQPRADDAGWSVHPGHTASAHPRAVAIVPWTALVIVAALLGLAAFAQAA